VAWLARTVLTEEERSQLGFIALELAKIRKQLLQLAETLVKISDKQFLETFNVTKEEFTEKQLDNYQLTLQKQADKAESEF
jgi:hypothetical protein